MRRFRRCPAKICSSSGDRLESDALATISSASSIRLDSPLMDTDWPGRSAVPGGSLKRTEASKSMVEPCADRLSVHPLRGRTLLEASRFDEAIRFVDFNFFAM